MATPKMILSLAIGKAKDKEDETKELAIVELVERVFTTRNLVHFAHWSTQSLAQHLALGELYNSVVDEVDDIVECYQGEFGLVKGFCTEEAKATDDIQGLIQADADWLKANRKSIANGSTVIENLLDGLTGKYNKILYKLKNLH